MYIMKALCIMYSTWDLKKKESQKVKISLTLFCTINIQYYLDKTRKTYCTVDMKTSYSSNVTLFANLQYYCT